MPKDTKKTTKARAAPSSAPQLVRAEDLDAKKLTFDKVFRKSADSPYSSYSLKYPNARLLVKVEGRIINTGTIVPSISVLPSSDKAATKLSLVADLWESRENIKGSVEGEVERAYSAEWAANDGAAFNILLGKFKDDESLKKGAEVRMILDISLNFNKPKETAATQFWLRGVKVLKEASEEEKEEIDIAAMLDD